MGKIITLTKTNTTVFFKNKILLAVTLVLPIIFYVFFSMIFTEYDDINRIPIAVIDDDYTVLSKNVIHALDLNKSLEVITTNMKEANKYLKNNRIEAIFILKKGFEVNIKSSHTDEIIKLIYLDKSAIGPALSDIVASDVMMQLSIYKAANQAAIYGERFAYDDLYNKTVAIGNRFVEESYFEMIIDTKIITPNAQAEETINITKILKVNTTFGYSIVVFSFIIMFSNTYLFDINSTKKRLMMCGFNDLQLFLGQLFSIILPGLLIVAVQSVLMTLGMGINDLNTFITIFIALTLHVIFISNLILLLSVLLKTKTSYQSIIAPILFLFGLIGGAFWSTELLSESIVFITYISPIYWSLKVMNASILVNQSVNTLLIMTGYFGATIVFSTLSLICFKYSQKKLRHP